MTGRISADEVAIELERINNNTSDDFENFNKSVEDYMQELIKEGTFSNVLKILVLKKSIFNMG